MPSQPAKFSQIQIGSVLLLSQQATAKLRQLDKPQTNSDARALLPNMQIDYVITQEGEVIPTSRHLQLTDNPNWDYIVGVGQAWPRANTQDPSAFITLPFALVEKNENCVHNGLLVLDNPQNKPNAKFYYQISSETCAYFKADFWGTGKAEFSSAQIQASQTIEQYQEYKNRTIKSLPFAKLAAIRPDIDLTKLALSQSIATEDMTVYGALYEGIHYLSSCYTRAGNYPFCDQLVLPSYSTAKSLFAGLAMFYLEQQYADVFEQPINKWVKQCQGAQWQGVTFAHLLNMSSGNYHSATYAEDEGSADKLAFFNAQTHQQRLRFACQHYARKSPAGQQFVYHTSETYLLGAGLNAYIKSKLGHSADIFKDVILAQIFTPLALSQVSTVSRRTLDHEQQAYVGYGLFFTPGDLVKLIAWIDQQVQAKQAQSKLAKAPLKAALQLEPKSKGMLTDYDYLRYQYGFWARKFPPHANCNQTQWLPFMSGFGGISVVLLGHAQGVYYFSDNHQYDWSEALPELQKLQSSCRHSTAPTGV
ncbi:serine hydrolase [Paraglaciecola aestuariivivens]